MPEIVEEHNQEVLPLVPREEYNEFISQHKQLTRMPRQLRFDLPQLPGDQEEEDRLYSNDPTSEI